MTSYRSIRDLDWPLVAVTLCLSALGVLQIYSATYGTKWQDAWWKQIVWVASGLVMMWVASRLDYHTLLNRVIYLYFGVVALLITTDIGGNRVFGSTRWIKVAGFTLQTSEFVKIVLVLLIAKYLSDVKSNTLDWKDLAKLAGFVGAPMLLVMREPDLGTSLTYLPVLICGVLMAGLRWKYLLIISGILVVTLPIGYY